MDTGPFFSRSITGPEESSLKGIVVRLGDQKTSICYDTELIRASAGWTGFLKLMPLVTDHHPSSIDGTKTLRRTCLPAVSDGSIHRLSRSSRYGAKPKAHFEGLYRHGQRGNELRWDFTSGADRQVVDRKRNPNRVAGRMNSVSAISRTFVIGPSKTPDDAGGGRSGHVRIVTGKERLAEGAAAVYVPCGAHGRR